MYVCMYKKKVDLFWVANIVSDHLTDDLTDHFEMWFVIQTLYLQNVFLLWAIILSDHLYESLISHSNTAFKICHKQPSP
jgi:hypothetical protein